ncbi:antiterminator LoaP [Adlercreutzia sp. ZJ242]|uniref:antiterminator LoaP n=1 Tax=Adlercreutzia sp. ZJ242 TaxID=2709409 RepID=UPI0013EC3488|nr:antiterminator LoaP [Adlercreutzia sp. ZJ242]
MWYVVQTYAGREDAVCGLISQLVSSSLVQECFVPRYLTMVRFRGEWQSCEKPLFPGYLIVVTDCVEQVEYELRRVPAFTRLLGNDDAFIPLQADDIAWISAFTTKNDRVIGMSEGIIEGDEVVILKGPLMNHAGWIKKINRHKRLAYLEIQMFGRTITTKVGLEIVRKRA